MIEPWFDPQTAGMIGGFAGAGVGIIFGGIGGPLMGYAAPRGKWKPLIIGMFAAGITLGLVSLAIGLYALSDKQPYHVWYPFTLVGGIMIFVEACILPGILKQYRIAEERAVDAAQLLGT